MSNKALTWAFDQKVGSPTAKLVLLKLADQANDEGYCWPSRETIAHHCEIDRRNISRYTKQLEQKGFLYIEHRKDGKVNLSNIYHLNIEGVASQHHQGGVTVSSGVASQYQGGGVTVSHEPSLNPQVEPSGNQQAASDSESLLPTDTDPTVETIPLQDGSEYSVTQSEVDEFQRAYPDVDIPLALARMRVWSSKNPSRRKKRRGVQSFINKWLSGDQQKAEQSKGATNGVNQSANNQRAERTQSLMRKAGLRSVK